MNNDEPIMIHEVVWLLVLLAVGFGATFLFLAVCPQPVAQSPLEQAPTIVIPTPKVGY